MKRLHWLVLAAWSLTLAAPAGEFDRFPDLPYADTADPQQRLDLAVPRGATGRLPVIVFIHGGAWKEGSKKHGHGPLQPYVESGRYAVASVEYRFSQHAPWPAQFHDVKAAIRWLRGNSERYGLDPDHIGVWGASAGGHLAALLGTAGDVAELEGALGAFTGRSSRVACVVDYFGPADLVALSRITNAVTHNQSDAPIPRLLGGPVEERLAAARAASPVTHVSADDPPFLIVHGTRDNLVPLSESETLARALTDARPAVPPILIRMVGAGHGFGGPALDARVRAFFDKHLRGAVVEVSDAPIGP